MVKICTLTLVGPLNYPSGFDCCITIFWDRCCQARAAERLEVHGSQEGLETEWFALILYTDGDLQITAGSKVGTLWPTIYRRCKQITSSTTWSPEEIGIQGWCGSDNVALIVHHFQRDYLVACKPICPHILAGPSSCVAFESLLRCWKDIAMRFESQSFSSTEFKAS